MFFKTATVACSLAALLMVGCENGENDLEENGDTIVSPDQDYTSPSEDDALDPEPDVTPPPTDLDPATPPADLDAPAPTDADEPVVEEVEADSLPEDAEDE